MQIQDWYNETTLDIPAQVSGLDFERWEYNSNYSRIIVTYGFGYDQITETHLCNTH